MPSGNRPIVCHLRVQLEQLLQPLRIVTEEPADVDAVQHLVIALAGSAEIGGSCRKVRFAHQQDVFSASCQIGPGMVFQPRVFE